MDVEFFWDYLNNVSMDDCLPTIAIVKRTICNKLILYVKYCNLLLSIINKKCRARNSVIKHSTYIVSLV